MSLQGVVTNRGMRAAAITVAALAAVAVVGVMLWQGATSGGDPDPTRAGVSGTAAIFDIGVLVFRKGLECILVLAAITASMVGATSGYKRPIVVGAAVAFMATLITWRIVVGIIDSLSDSIPALYVQAVTGLVAVLVLVIVMNWFFHKVYWTGWIAMHTERKRELLKGAKTKQKSKLRLAWGLALLGFTSLYREGFEVVLFLQNYRLKLGGAPVLRGVVVGLILTSIVGVLTFIAHKRLPYKRMLVLTGVLLGVVLLVMVGEQAQEMQLAHWLPTTPIPALERVIPAWMGVWFSVFPTIETLVAQSIAMLLVLGSYAIVHFQLMTRRVRATREQTA